MMDFLDDDLMEVSENGETVELTVDEEYDGERIDKYLASVLDDMSRSYIQKLIGEGRVSAGGRAVKANYKVSAGENILLCIPEPKDIEVVPENIDIDIIYEDEDIIAVNKQKGLVVHPAPGHESGTLVNALLYHCKGRLSGINGVLRPGIVHRIDRDTTGVIIACKNDTAHRFIAEQLKEHSITRKYYALVYNTFNTDSGRVEKTIGRHPKNRKMMAAGVKSGKYAATNYRVIENLGGKYAFIECELETGRTHQIRVHMASINHPVLGDTVYGPSKDPFKLEGQALHAGVLGIIHPRTKEYMEFTYCRCRLFYRALSKLRKL